MFWMKNKGVHWKKAVNDTWLQALCCPVEWRYLSRCLLFLLACHSWKSSWYLFMGPGEHKYSLLYCWISKQKSSQQRKRVKFWQQDDSLPRKCLFLDKFISLKFKLSVVSSAYSMVYPLMKFIPLSTHLEHWPSILRWTWEAAMEGIILFL